MQIRPLCTFLLFFTIPGLIISTYAQSKVSGFAYLDIKTVSDHSGIMAIFFDENTFDPVDTAFTNEKGFYETELKNGGYFVFYEKAGFQLIRVPDEFQAKEDVRLETQKLKPTMPSGPGKMNKMWNPYAEKCVCTVPAHHLGTGDQ